MKRYTQLVLNILVPILMIAAVVIFVPKLLIFFIPFVIGAIIAWIANPLIRLLNTKTKLMERQHASVVIILFMLVLIGAILYLVISFAVRFCVGFAEDLPDMVRDFAQLLREFLLTHQNLLQHLSLNLPGTGADGAAVILDLNKLNSSIEDSLLGFVTNISAPIANVSIGAVRSIPNVLVYSVVTIFSAYCFCKDGERYVERVKAWIPKELFRYYELLKADIRKIIQGWLLAQFKIMFVVFLVLTIGLLLLRVRYALPLAALTAFLDFLPMLGVGFIMGSFSMTGLGVSFPHAMYVLANGNVILLVFLTALTSFIMGMGMTTICCYIFLAVTMAPALTQAGLNQFAVHMFILYCGMLSYITPPVAVATIPAAMISGGDGMKIGMKACKIGMPLFLLPFLFIANPALLLRDANTLYVIKSMLFATLAAVTATQAMNNHFFGMGRPNMNKIINIIFRVLMVIGCISFGMPGTTSDVVGVILIAATLIPIYVFFRGNKKKTEAI